LLAWFDRGISFFEKRIIVEELFLNNLFLPIIKYLYNCIGEKGIVPLEGFEKRSQVIKQSKWLCFWLFCHLSPFDRKKGA